LGRSIQPIIRELITVVLNKNIKELILNSTGINYAKGSFLNLYQYCAATLRSSQFLCLPAYKPGFTPQRLADMAEICADLIYICLSGRSFAGKQ